MQLIDLVNRPSVPEPWAEGDNIPWNDPGFSGRMLKEHLSQDHDAASRRSGKIAQHIEWIHQQLLSGKQSRILDPVWMHCAWRNWGTPAAASTFRRPQ